MKRRPPAKRAPASPPDVKQAVDLIKRAQRGDRDAVPGLCDFLDHHPHGGELVASIGDIEGRVLGRLAGGECESEPNLSAPEIWKRKAAVMVQEITGDRSTPLERLVARRVVFCWFRLYAAESIADDPKTIAGRTHADRIIDHCHKRFLSAVRALAVVRRLALPTMTNIQVNVGSIEDPSQWKK